MGDTGILRLGFMARLGASGVERMLINIANSRDAEGSTGVLCCDVLESDSSHLYTSRGVTLLDASNGPKGDVFQELTAQQGVQVEITADFDAKTLTWEARNLLTGKQYGPRTVHYQGRFAGLDSISFWICGQGTQIDSLWVQDY